MRTIILAGSILGLLAQDSGSDLDKLQGTWRVVAVEAQGQKAPADIIAKTPITLSITGNKYLEKVDGKFAEEGTLKVAADKSPRQMDILIGSGDDKGKTQLAIYKLEGDTLTVAIARPEDMRPTSFTTQAGSKYDVQLFRRDKK